MTDDPAGPPTIYEWGGERPAYERWLNLFYDLVERDDLLAPVFGGSVGPAHRSNATTWWCEVMGGPADYTAREGGYEHMLARHIGLAITPEQRLRFVTLLSRAADDADLPADPEFRAALIGYAEWGSRLAVHNSAPDAGRPPTPRSHAGDGASRRPTSRRSTNRILAEDPSGNPVKLFQPTLAPARLSPDA